MTSGCRTLSTRITRSRTSAASRDCWKFHTSENSNMPATTTFHARGLTRTIERLITGTFDSVNPLLTRRYIAQTVADLLNRRDPLFDGWRRRLLGSDDESDLTDECLVKGGHKSPVSATGFLHHGKSGCIDSPSLSPVVASVVQEYVPDHGEHHEVRAHDAASVTPKSLRRCVSSLAAYKFDLLFRHRTAALLGHSPESTELSAIEQVKK